MRPKLLPRLLLLLTVACVSALLITPLVFSQNAPVKVKLIAINDFHGNLEPANLSFTMPNGDRVPAGGAEYLASYIDRLRKQNPNSLLVSAGDSVGATPLLSALFHDEPAIEALDLMGLAVNAVGNHEFDQGFKELLRLQRGGCHPQDGCRGKDNYGGAKFQYLAANVIDRATGKTILPAYQIRSFDGVKVAFIGMTLEGTPSLVSPQGIQGLSFTDEAETVNKLVPELQKQGIKAIVVLIHEGGLPTGGYNECPSLSGAIVDIVQRTNPEVDLFVTGHTHQAYNCVIDGRRVTSAGAFGRLVTDIDLLLDRGTGEVRQITAQNIVVKQDVPKRPDVTALIQKYKKIADPLINRSIGQITSDITRQANPAGETPLGNLIATAQLEATRSAGAVVAFMNPGGIRSDLTYAPSGQVSYGQAFAVQPFGNSLVTMDLTGAQIQELLTQQFDNPVPGQNRILQVSSSFRYGYRDKQILFMEIDGKPVVPTQTYRVTVNSFLAGGGDKFTVLTQGKNRVIGVTDMSALETYFRQNSPIAPPTLGRIQN